MLRALKGTAFPKPRHRPRVGSSLCSSAALPAAPSLSFSLCSSFLSPEPAPSACILPNPSSTTRRAAPKQGRDSSGKPSSLQFTCQLFGEDYYMFFPRLFFPSPKSGWSFRLPDSISRLSHPLPSGRLPDGAPLGHICSLFGKQGLIQVLS